MLLWLPCAVVSCRKLEPAAGPPPASPIHHLFRAAEAAVPAPVEGGWRTALDLVANRAQAHIYLNGRLTLQPGTVDFLKYVDGGWKTSWLLTEKDQGKAVALVSGLSSTFFVPVDRDPDGVGSGKLKLVLRLRALAPKQKLSLFCNEKPVGTFDVASDYQDLAVSLDPALVKAGENRLRMQFRSAGSVTGGKRSAAALARISLGPDTDDSGSLQTAEVTVDGHQHRSLLVSRPGRLSFFLEVPAGARLSLAHKSSQTGVRVALRIAGDGSPVSTLNESTTGPNWSEGHWDLGKFAGQAVRLDLVSQGGPVEWDQPRLEVAVPRPTPPPPKKFDHLFVWMVDTLRADKVHVYNPKTVVQTPNYDAFAADATRFAAAQVPGTWSLPSHASILTGVYPSVHKAVAHEARLSRTVPFTPEVLKKAGYRTALFSSNGYISSKWGFDRGWDESRNFIREDLPNGADYLWKIAKTWVMANQNRPLYTYLATVEPHVIYNPKKEFLVKYWKQPYSGPIKPALTGIQLGQIKTGKLKLTDLDKAYLEALHNAEITQSDFVFGQFLADLKAAGLYETAVVVVISDHGDEFWEHGDVGHAQSVHQELVHIPLIIRAPGAFPAGHVVHADVEAMDLHPTLLELAGVQPSDDVQGTSLLPLALDEVGMSPRSALSQNVGLQRGLMSGRFRLIMSGLSRLELYDTVRDPREQQDLAATRLVALRRMRDLMGLQVGLENRWRKTRWGTSANLREPFYADTARR